MRIALLPDDYLPLSPLVHAKMFHELALELKRQGHHPVIITPSHGPQEKRLNVETIDGVEVWRFRNPAMRGRGKIRRVLAESVISLNAYLAIRKQVKKEPFDACINYAPTIFFGPLAQWFRKRYNTYNYLVLRDMFPQWAIDEGLMSENSLPAKYFRFVEKLNYKSSDKIGLMSEANINVFSNMHPQFKNTEVLRNWADSSANSKVDPSFGLDFMKRMDLEGKIIFFYGGNIGRAQNMHNLVRLAKRMKEHTKAHFIFVGRGDEYDVVVKQKKELGLSNLDIFPAVSQDEFRSILAQVDVGLFSLARSHKAFNFPGKILGYMVESIPILGSVNKGNDLLPLVNEGEAGLVFVNGEDDELYEGALFYLSNDKQRVQHGRNGNRILKTVFSVESITKQIIRNIESRSL